MTETQTTAQINPPTIDEIIDGLLSSFDEAEANEAREYIRTCPEFKARKGLSAGALARFRAVVISVMDSLNEAQTADPIAQAVMAEQSIDLCDGVLSELAVRKTDYQSWSVNIPDGLMWVVLLCVTLKLQVRLAK